MAFLPTSNKLRIAGIAVIIIIVAAIALTFAGAIPTISSNETITLQHNASANFYLPDSKNVSSIFDAQSGNSTAVIYISKNPVLLNGITQVSLTKGQTSNLSLSGGNADLQITLVSSSSKSVVLELAYVPKTLGIKSSSGTVSLNSTGGAPVQETTSIGTTTIPNAATTTVKTTTTTVQETPLQEAYSVANSTNLGALMNQYKALYIREASQCTRSIYDPAYASTFGSVPSGPTTFANASLVTPVNMQMVVNATSAADNYNVTYYSIKSSGVDKTDALLQMQISISGQYVVSSKFGGDFYGLTYTDVLQDYQSLNGSDACSVYIG